MDKRTKKFRNQAHFLIIRPTARGTWTVWGYYYTEYPKQKSRVQINETNLTFENALVLWKEIWEAWYSNDEL